jgi:hypothetical protein
MTDAADPLEVSECWPLVRLEDLTRLVERHGITNRLAAPALYLTLLNGADANLHAAARNEYVGHLAKFAERILSVLQTIPVPVSLCPSYDAFEAAAFALLVEVDALAAQYRETSWRTKRPHNLRRISWDLAEWWKVGTGNDATAWRPNADLGPSDASSDFHDFLVDLSGLLAETPPTAATVERWLKAHRANPDYSDGESGIE